MKISAKTDYAVRAACELAAAEAGKPIKAETLANLQNIPINFLENILSALRNSGIVRSQRGALGGYLLAKQAGKITLADIIRAVDGPLAAVRGEAPEDQKYGGAASKVADIWVAVRASLRVVLEETTLSDLVAKELPKHVQDLLKTPDAWSRR
jgi:Rrf2 family protein